MLTMVSPLNTLTSELFSFLMALKKSFSDRLFCPRNVLLKAEISVEKTSPDRETSATKMMLLSPVKVWSLTVAFSRSPLCLSSSTETRKSACLTMVVKSERALRAMVRATSWLFSLMRSS